MIICAPGGSFNTFVSYYISFTHKRYFHCGLLQASVRRLDIVYALMALAARQGESGSYMLIFSQLGASCTDLYGRGFVVSAGGAAVHRVRQAAWE